MKKMNGKGISRTKTAEQVVARLVVLLVVKLFLVLMVMLFSSCIVITDCYSPVTTL